MIIDVVLLLPWVAFGALGFRDASARKLVAIVMAIAGMFLGQWLMHDVGMIFREQLHVQPENAPMTAFLFIFTFTMFLQSILYRFLTGNYKFGGIIDRIIGVPLGLVEGAIVISVMIFILTLNGPPSRKTIWDSRLYHTAASIAPRILDMFSTAVTSANETMRDVTGAGTKDLDSLKKSDVESLVSPEAAKIDSTLRSQRR
ncbi:MAG: CvpA family protein [Ignavibacteriales bacterium]|nr:CvpA family protein [Ignavibacteriales bacterium]